MGSQFLNYQPNLFLDRFHLLKNLIVPKPKNAKTGRLQFLCAISIIPYLRSVMSSIYLNDQSVFKADKIEDIIAKWMLTAKLKLPAHKAGASGKVLSFMLCPFTPTVRRGCGTHSGQTGNLTASQKMP